MPDENGLCTSLADVLRVLDRRGPRAEDIAHLMRLSDAAQDRQLAEWAAELRDKPCA